VNFVTFLTLESVCPALLENFIGGMVIFPHSPLINSSETGSDILAKDHRIRRHSINKAEAKHKCTRRFPINKRLEEFRRLKGFQ